MPRSKEKPSFKHHLGPICTLVFESVVVLLLLTHLCAGQSQVVTPTQPIVATLGNDIILPCQLEPAKDATFETVEWARPDLDPRFVYVWRDGVELESKKHPSYVGRTSLSINKLKDGDVSLKLDKVKVSDEGTYRCFVPTLQRESSVQLVVGATSSLIISLEKTDGDEDVSGAVLQCESKGWYPKPEVLWLDGEGKLLSAGPAETIRGPDGLYTVSSRVTVAKKHSKSFTCRVQQTNINQTRETHVHVADELFMVQSNSAVRIAISSVVFFISIVAVFLVEWKVRQNKSKTKDNINEIQRQMKEEKERLLQMLQSEKRLNFEKTKAKLDEELKKNKKELKEVEQEITALKNLKTDLKNQRDKLIKLPQEDMEIKERMEKMEGEFGLFHSEKIRDQVRKTKDELEQKMTEDKELIQNTDKLLDNKEKMIMKMTEKKAKLEREKDQINKQLIETQREELQKNLQPEQQEREEERNDPSPDDPA